MPELSHLIFDKLSNDPCIRDIPFNNLREKTFDITNAWLHKNPGVLDKIEENFKTFTELDFNKKRDDIIRGISDHYADKIALVTFSFDRIKNLFKSVVYSKKEIESVKDELKNGSNVILCGSHFGGIEWSAAILSILGIPCAIIANFKTKEARDKAFEQSQYFDADVIDINGNNREYFENLKIKPRAIITVIDAFDRWIISDDSLTTEILGQNVALDLRIDYFASKLKSKVYWLALKPDINRNFEIEMKKIVPAGGSYIKVLMDQWMRTVKNNPESLYIWDEVSELLNKKRSKV